MARVSDTFVSQFPAMKLEELKRPVVFVVDMINGFVFEGALADAKINDITASIKALLEDVSARTFFIADAHPPKTREFISYPTHCVIGTSESEVIEELQPYIHELFHKNSTNTFTSPDFQAFLKEGRLEAYEDIILTGCCSDICILQFALCLNAWLNEHNMVEKRLIIPMNCIDTYHIEGVHDAVSTNEFSIANMKANGITVVTEIRKGA